ncbi:MAG: sensor histidine kinase, partial [Gemmatirosa sp.]
AGVDAALLGMMGTGTARTGTLVLLLALATLPLRRLVWTRVLHRAPPDAELLVSRSLAVAYAASDEERADRWRGLLGELFDPLGVTIDARSARDAQLDEEGIALRVPAVASAPALRLTHARGGRRLFGAGDARLAATLVRLMRAADASRHAFEAGVRGERTRIARDLHDTVSSPLLAGLARAGDADVRRDIRRAVHDMRSVVAGGTVEPAPLADCVADARYAAVERLSAHGIAVEWPLSDVGDHQLQPAERTAFAAFVQEAVTNVLQHARATRVDAAVSVSGGTLTCRVEDDGRGVEAARRDDGPRPAGAGQGIPNLHARAATLGGHVFISPRSGRPGTTVLLVARLASPTA